MKLLADAITFGTHCCDDNGGIFEPEIIEAEIDKKTIGFMKKCYEFLNSDPEQKSVLLEFLHGFDCYSENEDKTKRYARVDGCVIVILSSGYFRFQCYPKHGNGSDLIESEEFTINEIEVEFDVSERS
jgi:hypothetical protein